MFDHIRAAAFNVDYWLPIRGEDPGPRP